MIDMETVFSHNMMKTLLQIVDNYIGVLFVGKGE